MVKTRAGLAPAETEVSYKISTQDVENFIQNKFDKVISEMRKKGKTVDDIKIVARSRHMSEKYKSITLLMPTSVLKNKNQRKSEELEIFNPEAREGSAKLRDEFFYLLAQYLYNKKDENAFFTNTLKHALKLSTAAAHVIKDNRLPNIVKLDSNKLSYVMVMVDPLRVFHDMLSDPSNKHEKIRIEIGKSTMTVKDKYAEYEVFRIIESGTKHSGNDTDLDKAATELNKRLLRRW